MIEHINFIIDGILDVVKTNNIFDILSHFNIKVLTVDKDNPVLHKNQAVYHRFGDLEIIYLSNEDNLNREFILAHELGHAILHVEESEMFYNPLLNKGKLENEANYFATRLLYNDLEIEESIETYEHLANRLGINTDYIKYIIK